MAKNFRTAKDILTKRFGLDDARAASLIDAVAEKTTETMSQFNGEHVKLLPFSQILQEANSELSRLNFSYDMLLLEYREAVRRAERLAAELKYTSEKLRHAAYHDSLTGLYNREYFQEAIDREILRGQRYQHPLSLILFDIDQFKVINDTHGHHCGDMVLKQLGHMVLQGTRRTDMVVRYGGEEFAILLPETNLSNAVLKAEACRTLVGAHEFDADGHVLRLTISAGVAACTPTNDMTADDLIRAADLALYRSKRQGRNRITVWDSEIITASTRR
jgi:diguanylate cyclase (GGDEF)-like protein